MEMENTKGMVILIGKTASKDRLALKIEEAGYPVSVYSLPDFADTDKPAPGLDGAYAVVFDTTHTEADSALIELAVKRAAGLACVPCIVALTGKMTQILFGSPEAQSKNRSMRRGHALKANHPLLSGIEIEEAFEYYERTEENDDAPIGIVSKPEYQSGQRDLLRVASVDVNKNNHTLILAGEKGSMLRSLNGASELIFTNRFAAVGVPDTQEAYANIHDNLWTVFLNALDWVNELRLPADSFELKRAFEAVPDGGKITFGWKPMFGAETYAVYAGDIKIGGDISEGAPRTLTAGQDAGSTVTYTLRGYSYSEDIKKDKEIDRRQVFIKYHQPGDVTALYKASLKKEAGRLIPAADYEIFGKAGGLEFAVTQYGPEGETLSENVSAADTDAAANAVPESPGVELAYLAVRCRSDASPLAPRSLCVANLPPAYEKGSRKSPGGEYNFYFGNQHSHSAYSGDRALGLATSLGLPEFDTAVYEVETPAHLYDEAKKHGCDFFAVTDHSNVGELIDPATGARAEGQTWYYSNGFTDEHWEMTKAFAREKTTEDFAALHGYEFSRNKDEGGRGHMNALNTINWETAFPTEHTFEFFFAKMREEMKLSKIVVSMNHAGLNQYNNFQYRTKENNDFVRLMEIWNVGGEKQHLRASTEKAWALGWKVAPVYASDVHGVPGIAGTSRCMTGVLASELTPEAVIDALYERRAYATRVKYLQLEMRVNGVMMGAALDARPEGDTLEVSVYAEDLNRTFLSHAEIIGAYYNAEGIPDQHVLASLPLSKKITSVSASVPNVYDYYYAKIYRLEGEDVIAYSAPVWMDND